MSTTANFVPSFYTVEKRPSSMPPSIKHLEAVHGSQIETSKSQLADNSTKHLVSTGNAPAQAMVSISPIRYDKNSYPTTGDTQPTQKLTATDITALVTCKDNGLKTLSSPHVMASGSSSVAKNLSNQFVDTPAPHSMIDLATFSTKTNASFNQEAYDLALDTNYNSFFPVDTTPMREMREYGACVDVTVPELPAIDAIDGAGDATAKQQEHDNLDAFVFEGIPTDPSAIDTSKLDDFELHSNGSFDMIDTFPETVPSSACDPKGIYATKAARRGPNTNKPKKNKPKRKSTKMRPSKAITNKNSSVVVAKPADLDILRGRGGGTNAWSGNKRFRDEARKLRGAYRHPDTSRADKFIIAQQLIDIVKGYGGRFLEKGADGKWYTMTERAERKKASQVLREEKWD